MASSGYAAWSVIAGEQPTTAKWNILGTNDASFNTGNGFNDGIIVPRHMTNGAIIPTSLDLSGIGLISNTVTTSSFTGNLTTDTLSYAIPAGATAVYIIGMVRLQAQDGTTKDITCWIDYNGGALLSKTTTFTATGSFQGGSVALIDKLAVAGGTTKTFLLKANSSAGNSTVGNRTIFIIPAFA